MLNCLVRQFASPYQGLTYHWMVLEQLVGVAFIPFGVSVWSAFPVRARLCERERV